MCLLPCSYNCEVLISSSIFISLFYPLSFLHILPSSSCSLYLFSSSVICYIFLYFSFTPSSLSLSRHLSTQGLSSSPQRSRSPSRSHSPSRRGASPGPNRRSNSPVPGMRCYLCLCVFHEEFNTQLNL